MLPPPAYSPAAPPAIRGEIREFRDQNTRVLNAMREDVTDLRTSVDTGFTEMRGKLDATAGGQQQIVGLLNTLITRDVQPGDE